MRSQYDEQLKSLHEQLVMMGSLCEEAISLAIRSLSENNTSLIPVVFETDHKIDRMERDIENMCIRLLLLQQPVARDLREISSAMKMISDMERIGDQASDIAEIAKTILGRTNRSENHLREMAIDAVKMVTESVDSFVRLDLTLAKSVIDYDDVVDNWFCDIRRELCALIRSDSEQSEYYMDLLMIAKYLERIGDHATNIAEWVEFCVTGVRVNHEKTNPASES